MDGPIQYDFLNVLNGWTHTECFSKHTKWMAPYTMFFHTYYMVGPIQNVSQNMQNGWPHTECFSTHTKWIAPYRMFLKTC